ncbi:MAG: nucleotide exchange factor GrpE [Deltaproteobacteria bacterium]|nr:MAG: nucleotide exchange factor GrpE [Deltaproteobacteria bacterium]
MSGNQDGSKKNAPKVEPGASLPADEALERALREATESMSSGGRAGSASEPPGSEARDEESDGRKLAPNEELERALREAEASIEARQAAPEPSEIDEATASLEKELEETRDRLIRLQADFENFRKRTLRERAEAFRYGHQNVVKDLLPTVDNLERAVAHARESEGGDLEGFLQGVELVLRELLGALSKHGVTPIEADGQPFDPSIHEAMGQTPDDSVAPNTVVQVLEKGYRLLDRLLRPTRVLVSARSEAGPASDPGPEEPEVE